MSTDVPPISDTPLSVLPDDPALLQAMIRELVATLAEVRQDNDQLRHRLELLLRRLYGPRAEKLDPDQGNLFDEVAAAVAAVSTAAPAVTEPAVAEPAPVPKRGHGRRRLPASLPRVRLEHTLPPAACACSECGTTRHKIREEVSEQIDYRPAALYVVEHVRYVYACPKCEGSVVTAQKPQQPIAKGLPGPGLLAQVAVSKYLDHLPLHRLERIFGRHGLELSRQTTSGWMARLAVLVQPLYDLMKAEVFQSRVVQTDDTVVPVQDKRREHCRPARTWVYVGDGQHPYTVFDYTPDRCRAGPAEFLKEYRGFLQADAYAGYDHLFAAGKVVEVGCWAHARRNFFEHKDAHPTVGHEALARIAQLYAIEKAAKERRLAESEVQALRQEKAVPLLTDLGQWLKEQQALLLPKNPLRGAVDYALNQWPALLRYTEHGFLAIDNNAAERALRQVAVGRKNWLFAGSDAGGQTAAILFTLTASAHRAGVDAFAWLREVIDKLSAGPLPASDLRQLLPDRWTPPPLQKPSL